MQGDKSSSYVLPHTDPADGWAPMVSTIGANQNKNAFRTLRVPAFAWPPPPTASTFSLSFRAKSALIISKALGRQLHNKNLLLLSPSTLSSPFPPVPRPALRALVYPSYLFSFFYSNCPYLDSRNSSPARWRHIRKRLVDRKGIKRNLVRRSSCGDAGQASTASFGASLQGALQTMADSFAAAVSFQ